MLLNDLRRPLVAIAQGRVKVWIVDALRYIPHPTHAQLDKALEWIAQVQPQRAILTNLHIDMDYHQVTSRLPEGVEAGYDGLRFTV